MARIFRRLTFLALLIGGGYAASRWWSQRSGGAQAVEPLWPPLQPSPPDDEPAAVAEPHFVQIADASDAPRWLAPVDGACPEGHPIKANDNSGIYHVPGGRDYARTRPERCYASESDAVADGYRPAKS
jgi:hypothetical protein